MGAEGSERVEARLVELAEHFGLTPAQRDQLAALLAAIEHDGHAPTAVREPERAVDVHVADSLVALELEPVRAARVIADLGAGAGFPGQPLAVALPASEVHLLESSARKCEFLRGAASQLGLDNVRVVWARAEEWMEGGLAHDVVLARALAAQPVVLEYAAPLLREGGVLVDWRGRRIAAEEAAAERAAAELGLRRVDILATQPFAGARDHRLHIFEKIAVTPPRFPRRAGMARKRPLGL
jgi:16S rRNA (guanine527-N7)-methyltransferase